MSNPTVHVAAVQLRAHDRTDFDERWPSIRNRIAAAAERARLVVVPEGTVPAYVIGTDPVDPHQLEAAALDVTRIAERTGATVVYGGARIGARGVANAAWVVTPDGVTGHAEKCFLWHFDRRWYTPGDALVPVATPLGPLGVQICADGRIPTISSTLVERGAVALIIPTAWVTSGRDPAALENVQADLMAAVRARENGVPLIAANKCGAELRSVLYSGKSQIVERDGTIVALAPQDEEATIAADVTFGAPPGRGAAAAVVRGAGADLPERTRIAIALQADAALRDLAATADATLVIDTANTALPADAARAGDDVVLDPRGLAAARLAGVRLVVWTTRGDAWTLRFARTRAAELRMYVVVLDTAGRRAYAVDPDGTVVAGTTGDFALAAFAYDRARADAFAVAPGTDVRDALAGVAALGEVSAVV